MPDFHQGFDPMGLVIDWLDACKERRLSSLIDLYDESATLDWAARARLCADFRMSNATFAVVRPITPTLCPARSLISLIFGASLLLSASPEVAHSATKFLRTMATVCASVGISRSPRPIARSALAAPSRSRASTAPSDGNSER